MGKVVIMLFLVVVVGFGYVSNIVKLTKCDFKPSYKAEVLRGVGIVVPPVGIIEGYLSISDGK